jgi:hypothetical protein
MFLHFVALPTTKHIDLEGWTPATRGQSPTSMVYLWCLTMNRCVILKIGNPKNTATSSCGGGTLRSFFGNNVDLLFQIRAGVYGYYDEQAHPHYCGQPLRKSPTE